MKKAKIFSMILCIAMVFSMFPVVASAAYVGDFADVSKADWFFTDVKYVVKNGLFQGTAETAFTPNAPMTVGMTALVLYRLAGLDNPESKVTPYYADAVRWAMTNGIVDESFDPEANITREQLVSMLYSFYTVYKGVVAPAEASLEAFADAETVKNVAAFRWAVGANIINGIDGTLAPDATATRAQIAAVFTRFAKQVKPEADPGLRIVCLAPSMVECVYALGYGDYIVGWSEYTDYPVAAQETEGYLPYQYYYNTYGSSSPSFDVEMELGLKDCVDINGNILPGVRKQVATVSSFYDYNHEILDRLNPTLVLCEGTEQLGWFDKTSWNWDDTVSDYVEGPNPDYLLDEYNAVCYVPESIDDIYDMMIDLGTRLGCKERAEELVSGYRARIAEIKAITENLTPIRTYFEIAHQSDYGEWGKFGPYTEGSGTPFEEMISIAGGVNIFNDKTGYYHVYGEYGDEAFAEIAERDPQVILSPYWPGAYDYEVTSLYEIMTREHFDETEAVQTGRVYFYDSSLMKRFGPRTIIAIEKLAYLLHPYYFENPENSVSPWELGKIDIAENFPKPLN